MMLAHPSLAYVMHTSESGCVLMLIVWLQEKAGQCSGTMEAAQLGCTALDAVKLGSCTTVMNVHAASVRKEKVWQVVVWGRGLQGAGRGAVWCGAVWGRGLQGAGGGAVWSGAVRCDGV